MYKGFELTRIFKSFRSHSSFFNLDQSNLSVSDKFELAIPFSATFILAVSAQVLLKVATKGTFRDKKT